MRIPDPSFERTFDSSRSGWFHPNALGEELLPSIALHLPAMRAFVCRNVRDADGQSIVQPNFRSSSLFADLAEAFNHLEAMELTLHHADGMLIPTAQIGIQDTEQLLALATWNDPCPEPDPSIAEDDWEENIGLELRWDPEIEVDLELMSESWQEGDEDDLEDLWVPYEEPTALPRYQVHVELLEPNAIP